MKAIYIYSITELLKQPTVQDSFFILTYNKVSICNNLLNELNILNS